MTAIAVAVLVLVSSRVALGALRPDQLRARAAIIRTFGPTAPAALRVAYCESRWTPSAVGGPNVGVFQINFVHHLPGESWAAFVRRYSDVRTNVAFAFRLSRAGTDWSAWTCKP